MTIKISTVVNGNYKAVISKFDLQLFEALKPKQGEMEIVEFTGSKTGDKVHIRFLKPLKAEWISVITEDGINESEAWFSDEGIKLPFPLVYWKHRHIVQKISEDQSLIIDHITYHGNNFLMSLLLYPAIFFGFYQRKKVYKAFFKVL